MGNPVCHARAATARGSFVLSGFDLCAAVLLSLVAGCASAGEPSG